MHKNKTPINWKLIGETHGKHGKQLISFALLNSCTMDYMKIFLSILLVLAFYILFGQESIEKLSAGGISISRTEKEVQNFKEPGKKLYLKL